MGMDLRSPDLALRVLQPHIVCLETARERPLACSNCVKGAQIVKARGRQAREATPDLVKTRVQINERFARNYAAKNPPGPGQCGLRAPIQRLEAIPEFFEHFLSAVGRPHERSTVQTVDLQVLTQLLPVVGRRLSVKLRDIGMYFIFELTVCARQLSIGIVTLDSLFFNNWGPIEIYPCTQHVALPL